ncbi:hypothetical protein FSP39_008887 [Pinctada imbricata]|uniref:C1q domain-containing protein n=1 Tax=Pinctada imbricata TaxID=66713 RepID=A0AA88XX72_PINIB|nr:hypothetical protein FSP39_008887 [Pinctada imbricata]
MCSSYLDTVDFRGRYLFVICLISLVVNYIIIIILTDKLQSPVVTFTATTSRNIWTTYWDRLRVVIFDYVITNVGGAYNSTSGIFTAPGSGNYCFSWTTLTLNGYSFESKLYRNGFEVYPLYSHANAKQDDLDSSSNLVSLSLSKGDRIWIVYISGGFLDTGASSFSGWKL